MESFDNTHVPLKTAQWLTAVQLTHYFAGRCCSNSDAIKVTMMKSRDVLGDKVQICRYKSGRTELCLHADAVAEFARLSNLTLKSDVLAKDAEWLSASQVAKALVNGPLILPKIAEKLGELKTTMPDVIQLRQPPHGPAILCLHASALTDFANGIGVLVKGNVPPKTPEWLNATELKRYFINYDKVISRIISTGLKQLQNQMPDKIQWRQSINLRSVLCLHIGALDEFARLLNLQTINSIAHKDDQWKNASDILPLCVGDTGMVLRTLAQHMSKMATEMPEFVQLRKGRKGTEALCVHVSKLDELINRTGISRRGEIPPKTDQWLVAADLGKYYIGCVKRMLRELRRLQPQMPDKIQLRRGGAGAAYLCLHISALDEFARLAGFRRRQPEPQVQAIESAQDRFEEIKQIQDSIKSTRQH